MREVGIVGAVLVVMGAVVTVAEVGGGAGDAERAAAAAAAAAFRLGAILWVIGGFGGRFSVWLLGGRQLGGGWFGWVCGCVVVVVEVWWIWRWQLSAVLNESGHEASIDNWKAAGDPCRFWKCTGQSAGVGAGEALKVERCGSMPPKPIINIEATTETKKS